MKKSWIFIVTHVIFKQERNRQSAVGSCQCSALRALAPDLRAGALLHVVGPHALVDGLALMVVPYLFVAENGVLLLISLSTMLSNNIES